MHPIRRLSVAEQTAGHLRQALQAGRWADGLPGVLRLAAELQVSKKAVRTALLMLEKEGVLRGRGRSRGRMPAGAGTDPRSKALRVGIFLYEQMVSENPAMQIALFQLQHEIEEAGHVCFFTTQTQSDLHHDPLCIARYLAEVKADAWVVVAARFEVLEWFAAQPIPVMAIGNAGRKLAVASTWVDTDQSTHEAVRTLVKLGHQRIVLICPARMRDAKLGIMDKAMISEMTARGIRWSRAYNVPDWEETPEGFHQLLTGLFSATPPTALLIDESPRVVATLAFLAARGWRVPERVSLVATLWDSALGWCRPPLAHMRVDMNPLHNRIVGWVDAVQSGTPDRESLSFPEEFVPGGSIGPVWKG